MSLDLDLNQILKYKAVAINYQWETDTHLLYGGVDRDKNLYLWRHEIYPPFTLSEIIAEKVKKYKRCKIFTNQFEPLRLQIGGKCQQFTDSEIKNLNVFYQNLDKNNRIYIVEDIEIEVKNEFLNTALYLLLKGFLTNLCGRSGGQVFFTSVSSNLSLLDPYY